MSAAVLTKLPVRPASPLPATVALPYRPESVAVARRMVRDKLTEWGVPTALVGDAELIVSELAANAAETGCRRRMVVAVRRPTDTTIRIAVRDGSRTLPCMIDAGPDAENGRGLALVHHLTRGRWGAEPEPLGKVVYADLAVT